MQEGPPVAKVGNIAVTKFDLEREVQGRVPMQVSFHGGIKPETLEKIKQEALDAVIERAYKIQFAIEEEIPVRAADLEEKWAKVEKNLGEAAHSTVPSIQKQVAQLKASIYRELLADAAERKMVDDKIDVTDTDVKEHYAQNKERYFRPKRYKASQIFVRIDPAANQDERKALLERAEKLLERARAGEDFYDLAYYESDDRSRYVGGDLGYFHAGQTVKEFDDAIQKMKPGEISDLIKTIYGYHMVRMDEVDEARQLEFDEVKVSIRAQMEQAQRKQLYEDWMASLQEKYAVERFE